MLTDSSSRKVLTAGGYHLRQVAKMVVNYRGQRHSVLRHELFYLLARMSPALAVDSDGVRYYVSTKDRGLSRTVFGNGSYEQDVMSHTIALLERHVHRSPLLDGRIFLDIGANIGTSTIPALKTFRAARAVSVEPDTENYKFLRCNVIANDLEDRVQTLQAALSDRSGTGTLERAEGSWGDHRVRMSTGSPEGAFGESSRPTVAVSLLRFDDMVRDLSIDLSLVGLVWMDVQGHEGHVLAGATSLLASEVPVAMEYWPYGLRRAGGLTMLHNLIATNYRRVVDIRASMAGSPTADLAAADVAKLAARYGGETYTDLLLLK